MGGAAKLIMAPTLHSHVETPRPASPWLTHALLGLALLAFFLVAIVTYHFIARRPALPSVSEPRAFSGTPGTVVRTYGSLPDLFEGKTEAKVALIDLPARPGVIGLGSLSDLRGEIAIVRGIKWLSYPALGNRITIEGNPSKHESAGFLALAEVDHWTHERVARAIAFDELAATIEDRARRTGLDPNVPLPIMIDGTFTSIELNVANGPALGDEQPTKERLKQTAVRAALPTAEGTIVGFFAKRGGERLIHTGEPFHLHIVLPTAMQVGHLDSARVEPGSVLRLPAPG